MSISVVEPVVPALEHTKRMLFRNFNSQKFAKWFALGFCAFLSQLEMLVAWLEIGVFYFFYIVFVLFMSSRPAAQVSSWFAANWPMLAAAVGAVSLVIYAIYVVVIWFGSRGHFMFLDGVIRDRSAIREPWHELADLARSLFWFRLWLSVASFLLTAGCVALAVAVALPDIRAGQPASATVAGIWSAVGLFVLVSLLMAGVNLFLMDFVVPIMYVRRCGVLAAWREFLRGALAGRIGIFILYILFHIALQLAIQALAGVLNCFTAGLAGTPYVGTHVLLLPFHVFMRSYSVSFLEQFGPGWQFFPTEPVIPVGPLPGAEPATGV